MPISTPHKARANIAQDASPYASARPPTLGARLSFVAGDAFDMVPPADTYFLKHVLHDFNDEECVRLLTSVRHGARTYPRLFVCAFVIPEPAESHFAKLFDVHMLLATTGRERGTDEYAALLETAGRHYIDVYPSGSSPLIVIEAAAS